MPFANAINQAALDYIFRKGAFPQPAVLNVGLSSTEPGGDGTSITEPAGNAYARVATAATDWARTGLDMENATRVDFPEATGSWGTLTYFVLFDNTSGAMVGYGALLSSQAVSAGQQPYFSIGELIARYVG